MMKKELLKKLQLGLISFSAFALLAACGNDGLEDPPMDGEPGVEEPADEEDDSGTGGATEEEEAN